ncbi:MAG TPA: potassium-transporting ATPase subunit KdpB [Candidatus Acidoferrales bacterium]|nr:potassium-transporting ATPase subunit KdpB [Candidatus Acidoferrales bacterium]
MTEQKWYGRAMLMDASKGAVRKLDPRLLIANPVMFVVEVGFIYTLILSVSAWLSGGGQAVFIGEISAILLVTVLFSTFSEAIAEGRGKAQAESLRKAKKEIVANKVIDDHTVEVDGRDLVKGDIVKVRAGEVIPNDGEVIKGRGAVDESAITGESAPVIRESGGDFSSVTGGTMLLSDELVIRITANPGESFLDKMIALVEGASRQKTPNEIALTMVLAGLTWIFLLVIVTLNALSSYSGVFVNATELIALLVCLIPTTIGGLLSAIGIAGMDRVTRFNVIAKSGKAVEAAGDVNTLILDKTGTITIGNRLAEEFIPLADKTNAEVTRAAFLSSVRDETPEGRSIVSLAKKLLPDLAEPLIKDVIDFSADTKMSGVDLADGSEIRKGAFDAMSTYVNYTPKGFKEIVDGISRKGATPLVVSIDREPIGVIHLKDTVKPGMRDRLLELKSMGIKTVMVTGDNRLTAATIAEEAGVDGYVPESKPEDKINIVAEEQGDGKLVAMTGDGTNDAPALAQADVGLAMNTGTQAAKEAANMVDLDSDPAKLIAVVSIGKQLLMTRGAITTFSIVNDVAKYFAIIPAVFAASIPQVNKLNIMQLTSPTSAILSAVIFNAIIIPLLIPLAMRGVKYKPSGASTILLRNIAIYGVGGLIVPFIGIKAIDIILTSLHVV